MSSLRCGPRRSPQRDCPESQPCEAVGVSEPSGVEWFDRPGGEPVELHEPSPIWASLAEDGQAAIRSALAPSRVQVEHVGSTAVPHLVAKPVVDLQVSVSDIEDEHPVPTLKSPVPTGSLKEELAREVGFDRFAYTEGKNDFIQNVIETGQP